MPVFIPVKGANGDIIGTAKAVFDLFDPGEYVPTRGNQHTCQASIASGQSPLEQIQHPGPGAFGLLFVIHR